MKHLYKSALCLLALTLQTCFSPAQDRNASDALTLTVDEAVAMALRDNAEIRAAERRVKLAERNVAPTRSLEDPMLMVRDWGTPLKKPWDLNQAQIMVGLQQTFTGRDKREARSKVAQTEARAAADDLETTRQQVAADVRDSCSSLLRNADEMRLHDEQADILRQAAAAELAAYTNNKSPQASVLRAQLAVTRLREHAIQLQQERDIARAKLNSLLNRDPAANITVLGSYRNPQMTSIDQLEQIALEHRPELNGLREQITKASDTARLTRLALRPDYTVAAGYMLMPTGSMSRNGYMAELTINLPTLNRARHDAEAEAADAAVELSRAELEARARTVFLEIRNAQVALQSAQARSQLYAQTLLPQAEAAFKSSATAYETGHTELSGVLDSESLLLELRTNYYQSLAAADAAAVQLERAIGAPLPRTSPERNQ